MRIKRIGNRYKCRGDGSWGRVPGTAEHGERPAPPSARPLRPQFLETPGFIEVVILKSETREGMMKAYSITGAGKKVVPLFKRLKELEKEILRKTRK